MAASGRLDVKRLRVFREAARRGSFARAGEVLVFSASAVSQQMSALERDLGVVLFERGPRGVRLTHAGEALLAHAESVLERVAEAELELESIAGLRAGHLRLGSFTSATAVFAAAAVEAFRRRHPGVEVKVLDGEPYESIDGLVAGELDLALVFDFDHWPAGRTYEGVLRGGDDGLELVPLFDDPFFLVVRPDHRLASSRRVGVEDLAGEVVLGGPPWLGELEHACRRAGVALRVDQQHRATGFEAFQSFVSAGRGVTLMPQLGLGWLREGLRSVPLEGGPVRHVKAALLSRTGLSPAAQAMLALVRERVEVSSR